MGKNEIVQTIKATMHSAGEKDTRKDTPSDGGVWYPSLYLNVEQLPELEGKDVDDTVTLIVKGKITSHSKRERSGGDEVETYDIEVRKIGLEK